MTRKNTAWNIWTLHRLDIEHAIDRLGYDPSRFSTEDLDDIAHRFKKGLEWACIAWDESLDDAVLIVAEDKGLSPVLRDGSTAEKAPAAGTKESRQTGLLSGLKRSPLAKNTGRCDDGT